MTNLTLWYRIAIAIHALVGIAWIYSMPVCLLIIGGHWLING